MNEFILELIAKLNKEMTKNNISNDLKSLDNTMYIKILAKLNKTLVQKELQREIKELEKMQLNLDFGIKVNENAKSKLENNIKQLKQNIQDIEFALKPSKDSHSKISTDIQNIIKTQQAKVSSKPITFDLQIKKDKLISDIEYVGKRYSKLFSSSAMSDKYKNILNTALGSSDEQQLKTARLELSALTSELKASGLATKSLSDKWESLVSRAKDLFSAATAIRLIYSQTKEAISSTLELDKSYTDLIKVQNELSRSGYDNYLSKVNKQAQELATTQKGLIQATEEFSKSGYNLLNSNKLSEKSTILEKVGEMTASDSSKAIISGVQAYDIVDGYDDVINKAQSLIDKYNEIGNTASITTSEIAKGVQSVGSVMADANTSVDQFIALLGAGNRQFQDADSLSLGLRTAALRIRGAKADLEAAGEETEGVLSSLNNREVIQALTGVDILESDERTIKSIYDIFLDISKVYKDMSDVDQSALLELIAGKHRASAISATLNNMTEAQSILENSLNSAGSAQAEYDKYLESSEAHIQQFKAKLVELYSTFMSGDKINFMADSGSAILDLLNNTDLLRHSLLAIASIKIGQGISTIGLSIADSVKQMNTLGNAIKQVNNLSFDNVLRKETIKNVTDATKGLTDKNLKLLLSQEALTKQDRVMILTRHGLTEEEAKAKLEKMGLTAVTQANTAANVGNATSTNALRGAFSSLTTSIKTAWSAMSLFQKTSIVVAAVSTAWSVASTVIDRHNQKIEEAVNNAKEAADAYKSQSKSIEDYVSRYKELHTALTEAKGNEEEVQAIKEKLLSLQKELNDTFGDEYSKLNLVTDAYKDQTSAIRDYNKEVANKFLNNERRGIEEATQEMNTNKTYSLGTMNGLVNADELELLEKIKQLASKNGIDFTDSGFQFTGNAEEANRAINSFMNSIKELKEESNGTSSIMNNIFDGILDNSSEALGKTNEIISKYKEIYQQSQFAEIASSDKLSSKYNDLTKAVEAYNNAVTNSDNVYNDDNVDQAYNDLIKLKSEMESDSTWNKYSSVIDDTFMSASTSAYEFGKAIQNNTNGIGDMTNKIKDLSLVELKSMIDDGDSGDYFDDLRLSAEEYGVSVDDLIGKLVELGIVQSGIPNNTETNQNDYLSVGSLSKRVYGDSDDNVAGLVDEYELLKEVLSDTGNISQKTYENLLSCSQKYSTAIVKENGRIKLNTAKLKAVAKSRAIDTKAAIQETLALKRQQWIMWANNIAVYKDQTLESVMANYDNIDSLQAEISQYALLEQQLDNTAGAFESFKNAQASENQSMYDTAQDAFNVLNDTLNNADSDLYGKFNSDDFQEAFLLLADTATVKDSFNAQNMEQYQQVIRNFVNEISPLFDENNAKSVNHLFEEVNKLVEAGNVPASDRDWADTLGISTDAFNALKGLANLYDFINKDVFESYDLNKLTEYQTLLSNVKTEETALGEVADKTSTHYLNQSHSLDVAKEKLQSFLDENKNVVTELFKEYKEQDLADAGTTFSDYIKKSLEYDEDDLDATIQALYEKYQDIGSTLTNKDKLMDSAKYGEYEQTARLIEALGSSIDELKGKKQEETQETENNNQKLDESSQKLGEAKINADNYSTSLDSVKTSMDDVNSAVSDFGASSLENASRKASELAGNLSSVADLLSWITTDKTEDTQSDFGKKSFDEYLAKPQSTTGKDTQGSETTVTAKLDASDVESYDAPDKDMPVVAALDSSAADGYTPPTKTMQVNVKVNSSGLTLPTLDATTATVADGTFNAFADGSKNVSVTHKQNALVNELGEEGLVRNGKLIPIKGGARFIGLKRGDIIFNHRQMKELKKNGHTTGRGRLIGSAYADGTVNAYAGGTSYKGNGSGTKVNIPNLIDVKDNNNAIKDAKNASKSISDAIDDTVDDAKDATEEIFDWFERRVKKFQRLFDKWLNQAETAITSNFITKYFKKATSNLKNELNTYGKSYSRYMKEANSVGLSEKYAKKVRNGTIDISTITDEDLADQISKYQEYYDKAIDATTSFVETAEKLYNLPLDKAAAKIERFEDVIDLLDAKLDNATTAGSKNKLLDQQVKQQKAILDANKTSLKETKSNLKSTGKDLTKSSTLKNSGVTSKEKKAIKKAVKSGKEVDLSYFKEGSSGYNAAVKYNEALKAQKEAQQEASLASEEYTSLIRENAKEKLDNIKEEYESNIQLKNSYIDTAKSVMDLKEAQGKKINSSDYNSIITNSKDISGKAKAEYNAYLAQYNKNLKSGIYKGDAQAQREALSQLEELKAAWYEAQSCVEQYIDAQNQIKIDNINDLITSLEKLQNNYEKLLSLRKTQGLDTTDDEILKRIDSNNKQIAQKALLLQEYQKQLQIARANGADADIQKYNDLITDTETSILDLKIANEELNDSIYDIRIDALNKEKEALQKLNDQEDRRRKIEDAKAAKEKANQRTDLVYDGKQFIYKRNEQTYKDAVDALRDLEFEELIHAIEDNVDILEELKNKYNLYDSNGNALNQGSIINAVTESADKIYDSVQAVVNSNNYVYDKETGKLGNIILTKYGKFTKLFVDDVPINKAVVSTMNPEFLKAFQDFNRVDTDKILENVTFVRPNFDLPESKEISNVVNNIAFNGGINITEVDNAEQLAREIESKLPNEIIKRIYHV